MSRNCRGGGFSTHTVHYIFWQKLHYHNESIFHVEKANQIGKGNPIHCWLHNRTRVTKRLLHTTPCIRVGWQQRSQRGYSKPNNDSGTTCWKNFSTKPTTQFRITTKRQHGEMTWLSVGWLGLAALLNTVKQRSIRVITNTSGSVQSIYKAFTLKTQVMRLQRNGHVVYSKQWITTSDHQSLDMHCTLAVRTHDPTASNCKWVSE